MSEVITKTAPALRSNPVPFSEPLETAHVPSAARIAESARAIVLS
jgi:hypothetical protein